MIVAALSDWKVVIRTLLALFFVSSRTQACEMTYQYTKGLLITLYLSAHSSTISLPLQIITTTGSTEDQARKGETGGSMRDIGRGETERVHATN
jgi:hypothetical protein